MTLPSVYARPVYPSSDNSLCPAALGAAQMPPNTITTTNLGQSGESAQFGANQAHPARISAHPQFLSLPQLPPPSYHSPESFGHRPINYYPNGSNTTSNTNTPPISDATSGATTNTNPAKRERVRVRRPLEFRDRLGSITAFSGNHHSEKEEENPHFKAGGCELTLEASNEVQEALADIDFAFNLNSTTKYTANNINPPVRTHTTASNWPISVTSTDGSLMRLDKAAARDTLALL